MPPDKARGRPWQGTTSHDDARGYGTETIVTGNSSSPLLDALHDAISAGGGCLATYTVLDKKNDPFRIDTPASRRDGQWLAEAAAELGFSSDRTIHCRGLHYAVLGRVKPDGTPYENTAKSWEWLTGEAAKAARFLGYIPFDQITDQRNAEPVIRIRETRGPQAYLTTQLDVTIPRAWELEPRIDVEGFDGAQPYRLALVGEKSSLEPVLGPIARAYDADLFLPTGEISDTQIYLLAKAAQDDGRPLVVLYFADSDPGGWQMSISVARKLQAFKTLLPKMPDFELRRVALTPEWVSEYNRTHDEPLPSSPLKETEKRRDKWRAAWGIEQTEIDSLLAPARRHILAQLARDAIAPLYDRTLDQRVSEARGRWIEEAHAALEAQTDAAHLEAIRAEAARELDDMRQKVMELNDALCIDPGDIRLPPFSIPEAEVDGMGALPPLLDSRWEFGEQCRRLTASKAYRAEGMA
jgi:hypothetical protein